MSSSLNSRPLSWRTKTGFGLAEIGISAIELMLQIYLLELYLQAGLNSALAGLALAIAIAWDAVSDPLMGVISDRTPAKTAQGKRLPYFWIGSIALGLSFATLFAPPSGADQVALFFRLLLWYAILNTALTLVAVPHLAIINDLTKRESDRATLFSWRLAYGGLGLMVGLLIPTLLSNQLAQDAAYSETELVLATRSQAGIWLGALAVAACSITALSVRRRLSERPASDVSQSGYSFRRVLGAAIRSPAFIWLVAGFVSISIGRAFNSSLALIYYKTRLYLSDPQIGIILVVLTVAMLLAIPFWLRLSRRVEKSKLCIGSIAALSFLSAFVYLIFPRETLWPVLIFAAVGGALIGTIALLESLFSDTVEADSKQADLDLSGAYYGLWRMVTKIARAVGIAVAGAFLSLIGYQEGAAQQPDGVGLWVAIAFGPGVAFFFGLGAYFIFLLKRQPDDQAAIAVADAHHD